MSWLLNVTHTQVPPNYDSLLGKLIVWGEDRTSAIERMKRALSEMVIAGVPTTSPYHMLILDNADFRAGNVDTGFIPKHADELKAPPPENKVLHSFCLPPLCEELRLLEAYTCSVSRYVECSVEAAATILQMQYRLSGSVRQALLID